MSLLAILAANFHGYVCQPLAPGGVCGSLSILGPAPGGTKAGRVTGRHRLNGLLTTAANAVVAPVHPKAVSVILTEPDEVETWLRAEVTTLQRPAGDDVLKIVARGRGRTRNGARTDGSSLARPSAQIVSYSPCVSCSGLLSLQCKLTGRDQ
jgi:hypothetical protein